MNENKSTFIFFESWERYLKTLELDRDRNYVNEVCRAIVQYGLYGECETTDKTILQRVDAVCLDLMNNAKARYAAAKKGGNNSTGRPPTYDPDAIKQMYKDGASIQIIADTLGCSKRTVQRALDTIDEDDEI